MIFVRVGFAFNHPFNKKKLTLCFKLLIVNVDRDFGPAFEQVWSVEDVNVQLRTPSSRGQKESQTRTNKCRQVLMRVRRLWALAQQVPAQS